MFAYVHHVHYLVRDRDAMVEYLEKNFGMKPDFVGVNHNGKEAQYNVGKTQIQIAEPANPNSKQGKHLAKYGPGVFHVAWAMENLRQVAKNLAANGNNMELREEGGVGPSTAHGYLCCNLDPESSLGVRFQLVEA
jgi:hypothetical protein